MAVLATLLLIVNTTAQTLAGTARYVAVTGTDDNTCTDPGVPCRTVQYAVDQASDGDEVLVATGVYTGTQARAGTIQIVYISKTVAVRGGYRADFGDWDPDAYATTLDAERAGRVVFSAGPGITLTLEGLRLTGGTAGPGGAGGGIYVMEAAALISNNGIYSNTADAFGGGIYLAGVNATLEANTMQNNTVLDANNYGGGGAILADNSDLTLTGNLFCNNVVMGVAGGGDLGRGGGGLYQRGGTAILNKNTFRGNDAHRGGGIYADSAAMLTLNHNLLVSNTAKASYGGALVLIGGQGWLDSNTIIGNTANGEGGGLYFYQAEITLDNNLFLQNRAMDEGGGLWVLSWGDTVPLVNNVFADNQATNDGGGLMLVGPRAHLWHTTLARNSSPAVEIIGGFGGGTAWFTNTLVYSHTIGVDNDGGTVTMTQTLWDAVLTPTLGAVHEANSFSGTAALAADGYHLNANSDAVDAGLDVGVADDVDGQLRPIGPAPDVGADEYVAAIIYLPLVLNNHSK
jgi:hypothetical protein